MSRVMVTGGAGFLGRPVVQQFESRGYEVFVPRHIDYDLTQPYFIARAFDAGRPEVVVHLAAAVGGIGANIERPGEFLYKNAVMGLELMEQARRAGVWRFVTIGTACEYPKDAPIPLREETIWDGYPAPETAPYGIAKRTLLAQGQAYREQYGFDVIHLIPTNLYGPGDNFDPKRGHVIPALINKFFYAVKRQQPEVELWGNGMATREFLYVTDAASAILLATERYTEAAPLNLGTGVETSIRDLALLIASLCGFHGAIRWDAMAPTGTPRRQLATARAQLLGIRPTVGLEEGLRRTIDWYKADK